MRAIVRLSIFAAIVCALVLTGWSMPAQSKDAGAKFIIYISPQNDTPKYVTGWEIRIQQRGGSWGDAVRNPNKEIQTPGLSGVFTLVVDASGPNFQNKQLSPQSGSRADIGCNSNCTCMIGLIARPGGKDANYWTVWDAVCK